MRLFFTCLLRPRKRQWSRFLLSYLIASFKSPLPDDNDLGATEA